MLRDPQWKGRRAGLDTTELIHELGVHEIELAMQNEELRRGHEALVRSRDAYRELYDGAPVGYLTLDARGVCLDANVTATRLFGVEHDALVGLPLPSLLSRGEADRLSRHLQEALGGDETVTCVLELARSDGATLHLHLDTVAAAGVAGKVCRTSVADISERQRLLDELRELNRELEDRVVQRTAALREANAQLQHELGERRRIEDELVAARKLEAVGRLAGGVAHDFNNLLTIVQLELATLSSRVAGDPDAERSTHELAQAVGRAASLTGKLLAFARREVVRPEPLDLAQVVRELEPMVRRLLPPEVELAVHLSAPEVWVVADRAGLERVVINLAVNARDSIEGSGRMALSVDEVTLDGIEARQLAGARAGDFVRLTLRDTGCGMSRDQLSHIFEPFYTTKGVDQGSGLGLATVYGIVTQAGGFFEVDSAPGAGTAFSVLLPRSRQAAARESRPVEASPVGGDETVLVVDDQAPVRSALARVLRDAGYTAFEAGGAVEGLSVLSQQQGRVHLVISDVIMPGPDGAAFARDIARLYPKLPVILMSGYTDEAVVAEGDRFLHKPFDPDTLLRAVRTALDHPAAGVSEARS